MRKHLNEAGLVLIAIPILFWTLFPIWHLFVLSISTQQNMLDGRFFPPTPRCAITTSSSRRDITT
jgi:multiple sugar transport system permease protein